MCGFAIHRLSHSATRALFSYLLVNRKLSAQRLCDGLSTVDNQCMNLRIILFPLYFGTLGRSRTDNHLRLKKAALPICVRGHYIKSVPKAGLEPTHAAAYRRVTSLDWLYANNPTMIQPPGYTNSPSLQNQVHLLSHHVLLLLGVVTVYTVPKNDPHDNGCPATGTDNLVPNLGVEPRHT